MVCATARLMPRGAPWRRAQSNYCSFGLIAQDTRTVTDSVSSPCATGANVAMLPAILPLADAKDKFQREYINQVLELNNGNRTKTARDLGVDPRTIFRHLEKEDDGGGEEPGEGEPPLA